MLSQDDVVELYQAMLGRRPESAARIEKVIGKHPSRNSLAADLRKSEEFRKRAESLLRDAFKQTDGYQAAYRLPTLSGHNARPCDDRCSAIEKHIRGPLRCRHMGHLRILDIGCSLGYNSLYFAERGAAVFGIDAVAKNIEFCELLAKTLKLNATFTQQLFSEATVQFAIDNGVNVVFLLSVLHHVIVAKGLEWARTALTRLLDNKITIIAELAKKEEDVPFQWKDHLPTNELEAFGGHGYRAIEIDKFPALNGKVIRSLYCVQQNILKYEPIDLEHSDEPEFLSHEDITFSSVSNAAVPEKQYVRSRDKFGKIFRLGAARDRELLARGLSSELSIGPQLASMAIAPRVLGTFSGEGCFAIIYKKVKGDDLAAFIKKNDVASRRRCAVNIATKYALMRKLGVYWNDCRQHNILIDSEERPYFIDFELASFIELEDNRRRFLWMMWHLCHSEHGGLTPEATLPTSELPAIADDRTNVCPEWRKLVEVVSSHDESEFPSPLVAGFGPTDGIRSLSSSQIGSGGRGKATAELATMPTSDFSPIRDNRTSGSAEKVEACGDIEVRRAVLLKRVSGVKWFHQIDLGGMLTPGVKPMANAAFQASVALKDIAGKTVLDVGAWDGYFSFAAERGGAARVLATDHFCWVGPGWGKIDGFLTARDILASAVEHRIIDAADVSRNTVGTFDVVLLLGVLYHLKEPFTVLERVSSCAAERLIVETETALDDLPFPAARFFPGGELNNDLTNWWAPNRKAVEDMLRLFGFKRIEWTALPWIPQTSGRGRGIFVAFRD